MSFLNFVVTNILFIIGVGLAFGSIFLIANDDMVWLGIGAFALGILTCWYARYRRQKGL